MEELLIQAGTLFGWVMTCLGKVVETITATPILLFGFLITLVGFVIGITKRLMNLQ